MHELAIAQSLIEAACETAAREGATAVLSVHLRIGGLAGVDADALRFSFEVAAEDTCCAGAWMHIDAVPVAAYCARCDQASEVSPPYRFVCPACGDPTPRLVTGRELELTAVEIDVYEPARP